MSLYLLHASDSEYFLFNCYGLFKIGEHDIARYVSQFHRFQNIVTLIAVYKFEAQTQKKAFSKGIFFIHVCLCFSDFTIV